MLLIFNCFWNFMEFFLYNAEFLDVDSVLHRRLVRLTQPENLKPPSEGSATAIHKLPSPETIIPPEVWLSEVYMSVPIFLWLDFGTTLSVFTHVVPYHRMVSCIELIIISLYNIDHIFLVF